MEMTYCISYARGHHRTVGVSAWHDFGGLTNNYLSEYVHYNISEGCPHNYLSEYVHKYISKGFPRTNKYLCFENDLSYMASCICEGVGEDSRHGMGHADIQVGICIISLKCV